MKIKPDNPLRLHKVTAGQYLTEDNQYLIVKADNGWYWQVTEGSQWVTKDKGVGRKMCRSRPIPSQ